MNCNVQLTQTTTVATTVVMTAGTIGVVATAGTSAGTTTAAMTAAKSTRRAHSSGSRNNPAGCLYVSVERNYWSDMVSYGIAIINSVHIALPVLKFISLIPHENNKT